MRRTASLLLAIAAIAGCGGAGNSSSAPTSCGAGTHDNGNNVCVLDAAQHLINSAGTYWKCGVMLAFEFTPSTTTAGTGQYIYTGGGSSTPIPITWTEDSAGIYVRDPSSSSLAAFMTLSSIVPSDNSFTAFSATYSQWGQGVSCVLTSGAISP